MGDKIWDRDRVKDRLGCDRTWDKFLGGRDMGQNIRQNMGKHGTGSDGTEHGRDMGQNMRQNMGQNMGQARMGLNMRRDMGQNTVQNTGQHVS